MTKRRADLSSPNANVFAIRLDAEEYARYVELWQKAKKKFPYITKADMNREIAGLTKNVALTDADIRYFRTGNK